MCDAASTSRGRMDSDKKYTVLHLFSGSGGTALGFKRAGFRSVGALDYDPRACQDLSRGAGEHATRVDIAKLTPAGLRLLVPECPDVSAESAPCVGFSGCLAESLAATEKYQDYNDLALHGIQLLLEAWKDAPTGRKVPGLIVFENVPRIKSRGKTLLRHIVGLLQKSGYAVHMSSHVCGEIAEDLSQGRPRFLLVARHMETVRDFLRKPPKHKPKPVRDALWKLPRPRPDTAGMHREPSLSNRNKLRLACIPAAGDWRDLPAEVYLFRCESGELEAVTGIRWTHHAERHAGKLGVLDWDLPAKTVIGKARVCNTWASVADPRVGWPTDGAYKDRPGAYGVADPAQPSATIRGKQVLVNSASAVADPRVGDLQLPPSTTRKNGGYGVEDSQAPAHSVLGAATVRNTRASVADPRLGCDQRGGAYGVMEGDEPAPTIVGHHKHDRVIGAVADPRLDHTPRRGSYGVQAGDEPSDTIRGSHSARQAPGAVADPRLAKKGRKKEQRLPRYDANGWPVPTHELVRLDDGRFVLYGPPLDLDATDDSIVIRAPDGTCHRALTDAELALLMGFPVGYEFCGPSSCGKPLADGTPQTGRRKRIGNAVPPPAAYAIARECLDTLLASETDGFRLAGGDIWVEPEERAAL
jgi:site-specific DNA-cytosine methylase